MRLTCASVALGALGLALAGCATRPPTAPVQRPPAVPPIAQPALSAGAYLSQAAAIDLFELRSSQLALARSNNSSIRTVASLMIREHEGMASQLSFAGRRLDLLPSAVLPPSYQAMLDRLSASSSFDSTWVTQQKAVHQSSWRLHRDYAARGLSPTLRPVASNAAEIEQRHVALLNRL